MKGELSDLLMGAAKDKRTLSLTLEDLLTEQEYEDLALRWRLVRELRAGKTQREVAGELGVSISRVTRGSQVLKNTKGGFGQMLKKLKK